jgi:hypothetical protein
MDIDQRSICDTPGRVKNQLRQGKPAINRQGEMRKNGSERAALCRFKKRSSVVKNRFISLLL